ncbi:MAG: enolase C-terminal domain-like protein [Candidatus Nanoarchaeia archaeon]|nr:enolase C-terminal domain-like protein [Candidatus Nanoarchaeia archaeon]
MIIKEVRARKILNSRKEPAIEVIINNKYSASTPSGASTGIHEVKAFAKDVNDSCFYINHKAALKGLKFNSFDDLEQIDSLLPKIGGNAVLAIQYAILREMSNNEVWRFLNPHSRSIPMPLGNVIGGGKHTRRHSTSIQEFLLMPRALSIRDNISAMRAIHEKVQKELKLRELTDEGAWVPNGSDKAVLEYLHKFLSNVENTHGIKVNFGVDMAASSFWDGKHYNYRNLANGKSAKLTPKQQIELVNMIAKEHFLCFVEDPLQEEDFDGFSKIRQTTLVCGDDLVTTNLERLKEALKHKAINCMIIKPNQIGSIIQTKKVVDFAKANEIVTVISHRSGETMDTMISDLAVAWEIPYIKTGIHGKERECKLQRLADIEAVI